MGLAQKLQYVALAAGLLASDAEAQELRGLAGEKFHRQGYAWLKKDEPKLMLAVGLYAGTSQVKKADGYILVEGAYSEATDSAKALKEALKLMDADGDKDVSTEEIVTFGASALEAKLKGQL